MLTCRDVSRLVSEGLDRKLSPWQRLRVRLHLLMCGACAAYARQIRQLDRLIRRRVAAWGRVVEEQWDCPPDVKQRLVKKLEERE